jgi:hypothetical protein
MTWTLSTGLNAPTSLLIVVSGGASDPPMTVLATVSPSVPTLTYTYTGPTIADYYYSIRVTATNSAGFSTYKSINRNSAPATIPTVTFQSFAWSGVVGSASAQPTWTWALSTGSGTPTSLAVIVYGDASSSPTTQLISFSPGASTVTYSYTGTTIPSYYYKISVTAQNAAGFSTPMVNTNQNVAAASIVATGGAITNPTTGPYAGKTVHTFTSSGNFTLVSPTSASLSYICVGGGGGGGFLMAGGGGGGNVVNSTATFTVAFGTYAITVGSFGTGASTYFVNGNPGGTSSINSIANAPGGGGGGYWESNGSSGGNGGGAGGYPNDSVGGSSTVAGTFAGFPGGNSLPSSEAGNANRGGGGGGAGAAGQTSTVPFDPFEPGSNGGDGKLVMGSYYGGGGGGGCEYENAPLILSGAGGLGGGGRGGGGNGVTWSLNGTPGTPNTGGGGGGGGANATQDAGSGARGGSGIVLIYY